MQILLVEDNEELLEVTRDLLEVMGHAVHTSTTGHPALELLRRCDCRFDALLTDVQLPDLSGVALLESAIEGGHRMALVATSASRPDEELHRLLRGGRVVFLQKPFSLADLAASLAIALVPDESP